MKRSLTTRGAVVLVGAAAATVMATGVSYAVWSVTGSGTGTAGATTAQALSVSVPTVGGLHPGASLTGTLTISNPNPFPVGVSALSFTEPTVDAAHPACTTSGVSFSSAATVQVPARVGSSDGTGTAPFTVAMSPASSDGCQGATFTATVTAAGTS